MLPWLPPHRVAFPPVEHALREPDGLLAAGGELSPDWLRCAYRHGIFPWFAPGEPILWWSPDPRLVLFPDEIHVRRSLAKRLRNAGFTVTFDHAFSAVIDACATLREKHEGTWITPEMRQAYCRLHTDGDAHSVEVWRDGDLVGGLYGIGLGGVFFGESMFSRIADASKVALVHLARHLATHGGRLIDCQVHTPHLASLGARSIARSSFIDYLDQYAEAPVSPMLWSSARSDHFSVEEPKPT
ncbi:leucyl/phenylalanyl-tRNA--protein transferase [Chromohalobacter marismortui]|uniref:Leucyl/phenylalanyl-tRNA--protein transferase n=1 Tax=Chromohalobacter marismortui TaxID=42055 RepID=A0A4R7NIU6_9GAMM|nr:MULTISPECIES: leucyl/phenylalanyl-tRNA--protein transferase [Chromohalobacter]MCI0511417.1 leucyl/phenylalanyl-tRNA--protein transferase [Chromohalobacter sp.]MCI0594900.1 leucyl/phenylalanyl-tRNA--protein transferase [Chromohalobacter sp.]TDU20358.1 leucyl/phenylalanyl-tRNA--protein transferase [Chromohalobacter marismortui]